MVLFKVNNAAYSDYRNAAEYAARIQPFCSNGIPTEAELNGWFEIASVGEQFKEELFTASIIEA